MAENEIIKASGSITREEELIHIEHSIVSNTMVLEDVNPFPGYHGTNVPDSLKPNSIYLVTNGRYDGEDIMRASRKIRDVIPYNFRASFGCARYYTATLHFIRLKDLDCFDCISMIQEAFMSEGINFMKHKPVSGNALVYIRKFFELEKEGHIYRDMNNPLMHYIEIPYKPEWEFFKKITYYIRGNMTDCTYDAALGAFYFEDIQDIVRIYGANLPAETLNFIRKKYLYELAHPDHLG